jgi:hypothetical protein
VIDALKCRPDPVADEIHLVSFGDVLSNPGDFKIRLLAGSEKAERLPAINIMKLVIDGYKDIGG